MPFTVQTIYKYIFKIWRKNRHSLFLHIAQPKNSDILLDVGGHPGFWTHYPQPVARIDTLNIRLQGGWRPEDFPEHSFLRIEGDGCSMSFANKSYDIVFSNSVIEHLGSFVKQQMFAKEIVRVGKIVWVQTPAYECPIEPHFIMPFVHWLPVKFRALSVKYLSVWGIVNRPSHAEIDDMVNTTSLLSKKQFQSLFPDCKIITERLLGIFPKSYIAYRI